MEDSFEMPDLEVRLDAVWEEDKLGRREEAQSILTFSKNYLEQRGRSGRTRSLVLNLDGEWGSGKTFFLEKLKQDFELRGHPTIYVNAWEDDHSDDPFLTVVSKIIGDLEALLVPDERSEGALGGAVRENAPRVGKKVGSALLKGLKGYAVKKIGAEGAEAIGGLFSGEEETDKAVESGIGKSVDELGSALLDSFNRQKNMRRAFSEALAETAKGIAAVDGFEAPIFVLIDELDRCRPDYAVELLEQIKHLFAVDGFVFVLGSDTEQLRHTINGLYGAKLDSARYLKKFVDRTYTFKEVVRSEFIHYCIQQAGLEDADFEFPDKDVALDVLDYVWSDPSISLRAIEQMIEMMATFAALWPSSGKIALPYLLVALAEKQFGFEAGMAKGKVFDTKFEFVDFDTGEDKSVRLEDFPRIRPVMDFGRGRPARAENGLEGWCLEMSSEIKRSNVNSRSKLYPSHYFEQLNTIA